MKGKLLLHKPVTVTQTNVTGIAPLPAPKQIMRRGGETYVLSTGHVFKKSEITAEYIYQLKKKNPYFKGTLIKQKNLIFRSQVIIEALDKNGKRDDRVTAKLQKRFLSPKYNIWNAMRQAFDDVFCYGISIWNPCAEWVTTPDGTEYYPTELRHLPCRTFESGGMIARGSKQQTTSQYTSELFGGIQFNIDTMQIEYHQTWDDETTKLTNIISVKDPSSEDFGGEPMALPIIPIIEMIKYVWKASMQGVNRTGAPVMFIQIMNPREGDTSNGGVSDEAYAATVLKNWGKDTAFVLRDNMTMINPAIAESGNNTAIIDMLNREIVDYFSPASSISGGGALFGGSNQPEMELVNAYINGVHDWLEPVFMPLVQEYLDINRYDGYTAVVTIPEPEADQSTTNIQKALAGFSTQALQKNEIRLLLDEEELSPDELKKMKEEYAPPQQPGMMGQFGTGTGFSYQPGELKKLLKETPMPSGGLSAPRVEVGLPTANTFRFKRTVGSDGRFNAELLTTSQTNADAAAEMTNTIQDDIADSFNEENEGGTYDRTVKSINKAVQSLGDEIFDALDKVK